MVSLFDRLPKKASSVISDKRVLENVAEDQRINLKFELFTVRKYDLLLLSHTKLDLTDEEGNTKELKQLINLDFIKNLLKKNDVMFAFIMEQKNEFDHENVPIHV